MKEELITKLESWLKGIGVVVRRDTLAEGAFLPGLNIENGTLVVDPEGLEWPGDMLHEAAHIALCPPSRRAALGGKLEISPAEEMAALAWSYAASVALGIDPYLVFHEGGYKKGGATLAAQYISGLPPGGPGVPMLQWWGMTTSFPQMNTWLRQTEDPA
jgi:hypothetical protein